MTQRVRGDPLRYAGTLSGSLYHSPGTDPRERLAPGIQEHASLALSLVQLGPHGVQVDRDGANHAAPEGNQALLSTLPENPNQIIRQEEIGEFETAQFGDSKPCPVAELE
jgi:hypothetical protein